jgi:hypothetical protein
MSALTLAERKHIIQKLRGGAVPEHGLDAFAVGIEAERAEVGRMLDLVDAGSGEVKFLRGGYGCGKTFMARLALLDARARGFATSFVVVSDNDLRFYKFEELYARIMQDLGTNLCARGAFGDILDRWIGEVEEELINTGADEDAPDFADQVRANLEQQLLGMAQGAAPADFVRAVQAVFDLKEKGDLAEAGALLSWICGSGNVAASAKKIAGIKGDIGSRDALEYLRGVTHIVRAAGYKGLVVAVDEAETILRSRKDTRAKSMNGLRQIYDAAGTYPGLLWLITGTEEFFDGPRGVRGLAPLWDRIKLLTTGDFYSLRQPQLKLRTFKKERLYGVALRLRELFPAADPDRLAERITDDFIRKLVDEVTQGFHDDAGVVPRQFLRAFLDQMDLVDERPDYDPRVHYKFTVKDPTTVELEKLEKREPPVPPGDEDGPLMEEDVW